MTTIVGFEEFADELDEFADALDEIADQVDEAIDRGTRTTGLQIEATAKREAPVFDHSYQGKGGELRADIKLIRLAQAIYSVGTTKEYAPPTEYGSGPHPITPDTADALHFITEEGEEVFTTLVKHPGTPAQPFLRTALNRHRSDLERNIRDEIQKLIDSEL